MNPPPSSPLPQFSRRRRHRRHPRARALSPSPPSSSRWSPLSYIIVLSLFLSAASCSTTRPSAPLNSYPGQTQKSRGQDLQPFSNSTALANPQKFADDLDRASLERAIMNQLWAMFEQDPAVAVRLGTVTVTRGRLVETLETFLAILRQGLSPEKFNEKIAAEFIFYRAGKGEGDGKKMLFTGYYRPVIQANLTRTPLYRYPLYQLRESELRRIKRGKNWRRLTRKEIDGGGVLRGLGLEIAWLKDDVERFFLHIQGSGILEFPDGSRHGVGYQNSNQHSYTGIGKLMLRDGVITAGSMQSIKKYFRDNPRDISKYLYQNKRYIFFARNDDGPRGSGGGELVGGRSIATDKSIYPAGGLAFIRVKQPVLDEDNKIVRWRRASRFVVDQDTGNAIRGPGRGDLFFGTGEKASVKAGHYHEQGEVYYLIKKS